METVCVLMVLWAAAAQLGSPAAGLRPPRRTTLGHKGSSGLTGQDANGVPLRRSKRGWMWNQFFLLEEYTGTDMQYVGKLHSDSDREDGSVRYVLTGEGAGTLFKIDEKSGDIHATKRLDREEKAYYVLRAKAVNRFTNEALEGESEFIIKIHDINDNEPRFTKDPYLARVPEMADIGTPVIQVTALDADDATYGNSAKVVYSILEGQPYFSVDPETGVIKTALPGMDREVKEKYLVVIQAKDMAGQMGGLSGTTTVSITLSDVNDNPPRFTKTLYEFKVPESTALGSAVGAIRAVDSDIEENAEMDYRIIGSDGPGMFDISTNRSTQEGIIVLRKPLDFERKRQYSLRVQVENVHVSPRFFSAGPFRDEASIKITVEDVDEPPMFERASYVMEVKEDATPNTIIGSVSASDPDIKRSPVRYSIDRRTDMDRVFDVHAVNGSVFLLRELDREENAWHNISVIASEFNNLRQISRVPVHIRVLDINDNAPTFATNYETFVCENAKANQRIQTVSATDPDEPLGGHRFFFSLAQEAAGKANFSVRDNRDNTAWILTRRNSYSSLLKSVYHVPVVISDGGMPVRSSTNTLTVRVCTCDREGNMKLCNAEALTAKAGLSTGALVAILLCVMILLMIVVLFAALRRQRKKEPLIISKEDVRDNVVSYNDEGGGEEDTQAFDIGTLRNPEAIEDAKQRRDILPEAYYPTARRPAPPSARDNNGDVRDFINQRIQDNDSDPTAPPYDSLATYAYEGSGSVAESLSSLGSATTEGEHDYNYLSEWGPRFKKLADMYGADDSDGDS
ncbi:cadherin-6-like isoform X1 [Dunckerocampus dactyliophorus]|uniref:cadherin-6-like isoform X1 n=1 Tax=Dunckerocampus dactyliophorus TaxID=161453 RepID=UPI002404CD7D|nr:cadherin-6-like isoform X1 [Dunckerocampus dactyliophorus]XP_054622107.1 cadherin-6-like isoform X1 [Dunckerocampus dactyliophorus]XP_054622108.1 cadherin-6-like isoform X1 [Dunckerocampus dactyliophorus]XP_054622109.1 cadherin-6-like isoform X1 [Dunckerocampus dactyliophorus]